MGQAIGGDQGTMSRNSRILVVDDDPSSTTTLELILRAGEFREIVIASSADEAFELLDLEHEVEDRPPCFDLILLDVLMPGIDGIEACASIRRTRRYRDVPILMCSGIDAIESLNQAFIAGAHDYLTKPIRKIELLARVRSALRLKRELDRRRAREAELRATHRGNHTAAAEFLDECTGLLSSAAFNLKVLKVAENEGGNGLLAMRIVDAGPLFGEAEQRLANDLMRRVAAALAELKAPLGWTLSCHGEGLFLILAPAAAPDRLAAFGECAQEAVAQLRLPHGFSTRHDEIQLTFVSAHGRGAELLSLPAKLIRALDQRELSPAFSEINWKDAA